MIYCFLIIFQNDYAKLFFHYGDRFSASTEALRTTQNHLPTFAILCSPHPLLSLWAWWTLRCSPGLWVSDAAPWSGTGNRTSATCLTCPPLTTPALSAKRTASALSTWRISLPQRNTTNGHLERGRSPCWARVTLLLLSPLPLIWLDVHHRLWVQLHSLHRFERSLEAGKGMRVY